MKRQQRRPFFVFAMLWVLIVCPGSNATPLTIGNDYQQTGPFAYYVTSTAGLLQVLSVVSGNQLFQVTIEIAPGVYSLSSTLVMKPSVHIIGAGKNLTRIYAAHLGTAIEAASDVTIKGMSIHNVGSSMWSGFVSGISITGKVNVTVEDVAAYLNDDTGNLFCIAVKDSSGIVLKSLTLTADPSSTDALL